VLSTNQTVNIPIQRVIGITRWCRYEYDFVGMFMAMTNSAKSVHLFEWFLIACC
jgi:hypothetical protein